MNLLQKISSFFAPASDSGTFGGEVIITDVVLVEYAASLASSSDIIRHELDELKVLNTKQADEQVKRLGQIYLAIEDKLVKSDPGRSFTPANIKQLVLERIQLNDFDRPFLLLFVPAMQQQIGLAIVLLDRIIQGAKQTIGTTVLEGLIYKHLGGTSLNIMAIKGGHIDFQPAAKVIMTLPEEQLRLLLSDLTRLFQEFHDKLRDLQGLAWADQLFNTAYATCKADYTSYLETMPVVSSMMPEGLLEDERLGLLSRETLTQKVKEATQQLVVEKASVEQKVIERTKELHAEQAKLKASIEALSLGFVIVAKDNKIITKNHALLTLLGKKDDELKTLDDVKGLLMNFDIIAHNAAVLQSDKSETIRDVNMGSKILQLFMAPVTVTDDEGSIMLGTVIVFEDVTEAKVLERSKDEFFSIASHELRTPLTAIRGNASLIEEYYQTQLKDNDLKNMVGDIKESSVRLISIVNDFLDMSRIEQGKMQFNLAPVSLEKIIEKVYYEMKEVLKHKKLHLNLDNKTLDRLPKVWGDEVPLTQILYNLLGNAVNFTEKGSISITSKQDGDYINVIVTDTGRGIPIDNQKMLFHKFQQAGDSLLTRDTTRGTGLGLYISRILAEGMKGTIFLEKSAEGVGSTFVLRMPIVTEAQLKAKSEVVKPQVDIATSLVT